ncbi:MAG: phage tail tape measure protein [Psychrobacter sp.]|uniref:phage tail tape measure protein n=1 Tax=Psychrobacter sp. TaxID=56811 RepID=UPI00264A084E|nr:phage tail tape measure protein [Psychrobacter sp.]MDN5619090.1 phage tail tape measure protein [Psychrobacter sp.]
MAARLDTELLITAGVNGLSQIDNLINRIDAAGGDTDQLRQASEQLRNEWDNLSADEQAQRLRDLGNAANQGADDVDILGRNTDQTTSAFDRMIGTLKTLGALIGITFIIGKIKGFFTEAITGAADFEQQLATVQSVSGATVEQMGRIKAASEELGKTTRYNATQAAEGFEILARAGLDTEASLQTIPSVLALAQGNSLELAEAAGFVTKAVQGMGLSFDDSARVADVMAKAAASANTDVQGLGAALSYAAPSAAALGVSIEETAAYIGKFADAGVDASRAGTAFNSILSQFSNDASTFRRELANINITTDDFNLAIRQLAAAGPQGQKAINALGMEAGPAFKALLSQGIGSLDELTAKLYDAGGAAQSQADTMNNTWQGALAGLGSAWQSLKDTLGESFLGSMTQSFKDLGDEINNLTASGKIKRFGDSVAAVFSEATTYVIDFIRNVDMSAILDKVSNSLDYLRGISTAANGAFQALAITFNVLKSGVLAIGVAVSMVITVFVELNKLTLDVGRSVAGFFGITSDAADGMSESMGNVLQASEDFREYATAEIAKSGESIRDSFDSIAGSADEAAIEVVSAGDQIADTFGGIVDAAFQGSQETGAAVDQIRADVAAMIDSFDKPEQFAALIAAIVETGNEAVVGAELLSRLGAGAADGTEQAKVAVDQATAAVEKLGNAANEQAEATRQAIDGTFASLGIDVAQNLNGINSKTQQTFDLIAHGAKSISESTYSATEKAKLLAALFAEGLNAAKTKEEFKALSDMTQHYGLSSVVTAEQQKVLQAGMQGGAYAAKAAADAIAAQSQALADNAVTTNANTSTTKANTDAKKEQSIAVWNASMATDDATQSESASLAIMQQITARIKGKIAALEEMGATTEQVDGAWAQFMDSVGIFEGQRFLGVQDFANNMQRVDDVVTSQITSFTQAKARAEEMTDALSGTSVTSRDLTDAQHALRQATDANIKGLIRMDQATLDNLQNAIDDTKQKMTDLADEARETANQLEGELARLRGEDDKALEIQQTKDLKKLEDLLREARKRGNAEEVKHYSDALRLQKEINKEERKQLKRQEQEKREREAEKQAKSPSASSSSSRQTSRNGTSNNSYSASDVADAWDARIEAAKEQAAKEAVEQFMKQLKDEAKRRS